MLFLNGRPFSDNALSVALASTPLHEYSDVLFFLYWQVTRAKAILLAADGLDNKRFAQRQTGNAKLLLVPVFEFRNSIQGTPYLILLFGAFGSRLLAPGPAAQQPLKPLDQSAAPPAGALCAHGAGTPRPLSRRK